MGLAPGKLPNNTPIKHLIPASQYGHLTGAAQKLTKGELIALQQWGLSGGKSGAPPKHLTIADLQSLHKAMPAAPSSTPKGLPAPPAGVAAGPGISCCCCTPCCCCTAAAEIMPVRLLQGHRQETILSLSGR